MSKMTDIAAMLPEDVPAEVRYQRVTTAAALFRQAIFTLETNGMPGPAVMAVLGYVIESETVARASQEARANGS